MHKRLALRHRPLDLRDSNLLVYKSRVAVSAGEVFPSIADENNYNYNG